MLHPPPGQPSHPTSPHPASSTPPWPPSGGFHAHAEAEEAEAEELQGSFPPCVNEAESGGMAPRRAEQRHGEAESGATARRGEERRRAESRGVAWLGLGENSGAKAEELEGGGGAAVDPRAREVGETPRPPPPHLSDPTARHPSPPCVGGA